ncbi:MAG: hypothetical protein JNK65_01640 [Deltaproteobacteria bacterium]|nr:hypothetical protein [Deltaproteobacteria bacterium]
MERKNRRLEEGSRSQGILLSDLALSIVKFIGPFETKEPAIAQFHLLLERAFVHLDREFVEAFYEGLGEDRKGYQELVLRKNEQAKNTERLLSVPTGLIAFSEEGRDLIPSALSLRERWFQSFVGQQRTAYETLHFLNSAERQAEVMRQFLQTYINEFRSDLQQMKSNPSLFTTSATGLTPLVQQQRERYRTRLIELNSLSQILIPTSIYGRKREFHCHFISNLFKDPSFQTRYRDFITDLSSLPQDAMSGIFIPTLESIERNTKLNLQTRR